MLLATLLAVGVSAAADPPVPEPPPRWTSRLFTDVSAPVSSAEPPVAPKKKKCACSDAAVRADRMACLPSLIVHDAAWVFTEPARWTGRDWGLFTTGVLGIGLLVAVDDDIRTIVLDRGSGFNDHVARAFEPFGTWASFLVIGGFYAGGLAAHDRTAHGVAIDALAASAIAGVVITPALKWMVGRSRPNAGEGPYHFEPFHGGASFPSGHATQAFAVASVIATTYRKPWVSAACYVPASLVLYARMRHDAHWASDVTAGALIGYGVGSEVVHFNRGDVAKPARARLVPLIAPKTTGLVLAASL